MSCEISGVFKYDIMDRKASGKMKKTLKELTLEELWRLFPIFLVPHNPLWSQWFEVEAKDILSILKDVDVVAIHHIGSTAVPEIWAKNIVDILLIVEKPEDLFLATQKLICDEWIIMSHTQERVSLNKGYTSEGFAEKVYHLHLRLPQDADELIFRDYLIRHPDVAKEYETLKLVLWKQYVFDRDGYTTAKTEFVKHVTELAKQEKEKP